jgi:hypothetical protein
MLNINIKFVHLTILQNLSHLEISIKLALNRPSRPITPKIGHRFAPPQTLNTD